jgi:NAD(P)-dependent dehydrogenase (short-subunit alcohol dehydrogenase family)
MTTPRVAVVTGANSGFGYATAPHLARDGFHVLAGVRDPAEADRLLVAADGLTLDVIKLDVTSDVSVAEAFAAAPNAGASTPSSTTPGSAPAGHSS